AAAQHAVQLAHARARALGGLERDVRQRHRPFRPRRTGRHPAAARGGLRTRRTRRARARARRLARRVPLTARRAMPEPARLLVAARRAEEGGLRRFRRLGRLAAALHLDALARGREVWRGMVPAERSTMAAARAMRARADPRVSSHA